MKIIDYCVCCESKKLDKNSSVIVPFVMNRIFAWDMEIVDESWGLKDIKQGNLYQRSDSLQCKSCGHLFSSVRFDDDEMEKLYLDYRNDEYVNTRERFESGYKNINEKLKQGYSYKNKIEKFLSKHLKNKKKKILDFGGDSGKNTPFVDDKNSKVFVYDISNNETIKKVQKVDKKELNKYDYDLIVCAQVLEHLSFPKKIIKDIKKYGTNDTLFYFEVPFERLILEHKKSSFLYKRHWHEHINFFTKKSLCTLLEKEDLEVLETKKFKIDFNNSEIFILGVVCKRKNYYNDKK